jgi:hypothetical protein
MKTWLSIEQNTVAVFKMSLDNVSVFEFTCKLLSEVFVHVVKGISILLGSILLCFLALRVHDISSRMFVGTS